MSSWTNLELLPIVKKALESKNLENISVEIVGKPEKGDGYNGDIIFALIRGNVNEVPQQYDVVLKCGKKSKVLRENTPAIRDSFENEISVYTKIFPTLEEFAIAKSPDLVFDCIPKCLGTYLDENMELIVLENLKKSGYVLWNRQKPATLEHLKVVLHQYGKLHALSATLRDQQPQKYREMSKYFVSMFVKYSERVSLSKFFGGPIDQGCDLLKDELDEETRQIWLNLKDQIEETLLGHTTRKDCFTVFSHGDCWINNFMFKCEKGDPVKPTRAVFIDWQLSSDYTPVCDLSYFLYSSISPKDLEDSFDSLLKWYHDSFSSYVKKLGSVPDKMYSYEEFLKDWKRFGRFGILMTPLVFKLAFVDKENAPDIAEGLESGKGFEEVFNAEIKETAELKLRLKSLVQHAVSREFI